MPFLLWLLDYVSFEIGLEIMIYIKDKKSYDDHSL
jgi:hypothetical protein